jgi:hypothetical protein
MKSRRAEQVLQAASFTNEYDYQYVCIDSAYAAVELAEKAHKIVKEMMMAISKGNTPQKMADEFIQKLNER